MPKGSWEQASDLDDMHSAEAGKACAAKVRRSAALFFKAIRVEAFFEKTFSEGICILKNPGLSEGIQSQPVCGKPVEQTADVSDESMELECGRDVADRLSSLQRLWLRPIILNPKIVSERMRSPQ
jgi:hypothetical protein